MHITPHTALTATGMPCCKACPRKAWPVWWDCAVDLATAREELALAGQYPFVYAALGIHPESIIEEDTSTRLVFGGDWRAELRAIRPLYEHPKAVGRGRVRAGLITGPFPRRNSRPCLKKRFAVHWSWKNPSLCTTARPTQTYMPF